ncbi:uncharacterized protein EI97DRAFT_446543 [Westerdykella ornata]|uniref:SAP domain-containing protein n=1 Tax=Westerdykella ornata TaxID=318751 RepID=A0A6A6J5P4_WESOR|nr:uncharacterized protein EI97DRAFT_446543 [Westerdykella ornata]KAF2271517.1 hypothetical protein EI97DRAFT_446543 [Westerdykella ornata]
MAGAAPMDLDAFKKLSKPKMIEVLKTVPGLKTSGNKPALEKIWKDHLDSLQAQDTTAGAAVAHDEAESETAPTQAGAAAEAEDTGDAARQAEASNDPAAPSNNSRSMLARLTTPRTIRLSMRPMETIKLLGFKRKFRAKNYPDDLSEYLEPVHHFAVVLREAQNKFTLKTSHAENFVQLRMEVLDMLPSISAPPVLEEFFASWGIKTIHSKRASPSIFVRGDKEEDRQVQMAIAASLMTARGALGDAGDQEEETADQEEELKKAIQEELDALVAAVEYSLNRWAATFPAPGPAEILWPVDFSDAEKKTLRAFVREKLEEKNILEEQLSQEDRTAHIDDIWNAADFPLAKGKVKSVVQAVFLEVRNTAERSEKRRSKSASSRGGSQSRRGSISTVASRSPEQSRRGSLSTHASISPEARRRSLVGQTPDDVQDTIETPEVPDPTESEEQGHGTKRARPEDSDGEDDNDDMPVKRGKRQSSSTRGETSRGRPRGRARAHCGERGYVLTSTDVDFADGKVKTVQYNSAKSGMQTQYQRL